MSGDDFSFPGFKKLFGPMLPFNILETSMGVYFSNFTGFNIDSGHNMKFMLLIKFVKIAVSNLILFLKFECTL